MGDGVSADTARPDEGGKTIVKFGFLSAVPFLAGFFVAFVGVHIIEVRWGLNTAVLQPTPDPLGNWITLIPTKDLHVEARYGVAASFLFLVAAGAAAFAQSFRQMWLSFAKNHILTERLPWLKARWVVPALAIILGVFILSYVDSKSGDLRTSLMPQAFNLTLGKCAATGCLPDAPVPVKNSFLGLVDKKIGVENFISAFVSVFVAVAACCLVIQCRNIREEEADAAARDLFAKLAQRWKNLLYSASLYLVAGIVTMSAWRTWPTAYMDPYAAATAAFRAAADGTVLVHGLLFTTILLAIFLPAATIMNDTYVERGLDKSQDGKTSALPLSDFKNLLSLKEITKSGLAILAPVISGSVPVIADLIGGLN